MGFSPPNGKLGSCAGAGRDAIVLPFPAHPDFELDGTRLAVPNLAPVLPLDTWLTYQPVPDLVPAHWGENDYLHWHLAHEGAVWALARAVRNREAHALRGKSATGAVIDLEARPRAKARLAPPGRHVQLQEAHLVELPQPVGPLVDLPCNDCRALFAKAVYSPCARCRPSGVQAALRHLAPVNQLELTFPSHTSAFCG